MVAEASPRLPPNLIVSRADGGMLLRNLAAFASLLRQAGLHNGLHKTTMAGKALACTGVDSKTDVFWALAAVFVERREQLRLFRQAFNLYWHGHEHEAATEGNGDATAGLLAPLQRTGGIELPAEQEGDEALTASAKETLHDKDFAQMGKREWHAAARALHSCAALLAPLPCRRRVSARHGKLDLRRTVRHALAHHGDPTRIIRSLPSTKAARLVVLVDISGSMGNYARAFLHFTAGILSQRHCRANCFLLGTRLTALRHRDGDPQLLADQIAKEAPDWGGGTRLTPALHEFNRHWIRRCGIASATVLFATDGLEIDCKPARFGAELARLHKSCRQLVWLNPLLRYDRYAPLACGASVLARNTDKTLSIHNVRTIMQLATTLSLPAQARTA